MPQQRRREFRSTIHTSLFCTVWQSKLPRFSNATQSVVRAVLSCGSETNYQLLTGLDERCSLGGGGRGGRSLCCCIKVETKLNSHLHENTAGFVAKAVWVDDNVWFTLTSYSPHKTHSSSPSDKSHELQNPTTGKAAAPACCHSPALSQKTKPYTDDCISLQKDSRFISQELLTSEEHGL